jgi:hypothetical protein
MPDSGSQTDEQGHAEMSLGEAVPLTEDPLEMESAGTADSTAPVAPIDEPGEATEAADPGDAAVVLTEVVSDDELFEDADLGVARMASGEEQLIVVPVELGDVETGVRRFKLSVRLRLEPVD